MTQKTSSDPLEHLPIAAQQGLFAGNSAYARMAEAMRDIAQANARYMQELMDAQAALFAACMTPSDEHEERPSKAARRHHH
jgi:hypothetical protein